MDLDSIKKRMEGALKAFAGELSGLRTGRASPSLLDGVSVEAYGGRTPLSQVAGVSAPEARLITVQVWDATLTKAIEKAIASSGLGLNPAAEGSLIRVPIPELSQERRAELTKVAAKYAENAKIAVRNVRRDGMDELKKEEKDGKISQDEHKKLGEQIQKETDAFIKKIEEALAAKEKEIMQI